MPITRSTSPSVLRSRAFLRGEQIKFAEANELWKQLKREDELALARAVLDRIRNKKSALLDRIPPENREQLCQQHAEITSKDPELNVALRYDQALEILDDVFNLKSSALDGDGETLGIAGGIYKRRWNDLGQLDDLQRAAKLYERGAKGELGDDAYPHINSAFLADLLASAGDNPVDRQQRAKAMRQRITKELAPSGTWFNAATLAQAYFGLGQYQEAKDALATTKEKPAPWQLQTTAQQFAQLAHIQEKRPMENAGIAAFFKALLPGAADAIQSVSVGKVGLALSGGGFRASFYHLGVLARLAELDVLRHVDVLSCVSGGSIIGACYWLALRNRLLDPKPLERDDYIQVVNKLIAHFRGAVATDLRGQTQPGRLKLFWRAVKAEKGALDPEQTALALEEKFYRPLLPGAEPLFMDKLPFTPADYDATLSGTTDFSPGKHNWLRAHKVPVLVLNATSVNTGHAWQFTPTWMGESPWAVYGSADSNPRLEWSWYEESAQWQIKLGRAVAASACVPFIFAPLRIDDMYTGGVQVQLVDGGVHDNQGTVSLLALNCNVLLVSDASGQLLFQKAPTEGFKGLGGYAQRSSDTLMERVRLANYADLSARLRSGLLRGLMFLHMKAGLDADTVRLRFSQESYDIERAALSPSGVRKDFQQRIAELRTDLDDFTDDESLSLMACGYQMSSKAFERDLAHLTELGVTAGRAKWPFDELLAEITSTEADTPRRQPLLAHLTDGSKVNL
ncbi:MAG: patatin-like phospholipase family protein [Bryobacteraceae bacterium]